MLKNGIFKKYFLHLFQVLIPLTLLAAVNAGFLPIEAPLQGLPVETEQFHSAAIPTPQFHSAAIPAPQFHSVAIPATQFQSFPSAFGPYPAAQFQAATPHFEAAGIPTGQFHTADSIQGLPIQSAPIQHIQHVHPVAVPIQTQQFVAVQKTVVKHVQVSIASSEMFVILTAWIYT